MSSSLAPLNDQVQEIVQTIQFGTFHHPDRFLQTAELVAKAFKKRADQLELFKTIGPSKHLLVEGWQMLAAMYHVSASEESHQYVTFGDAAGFEATYIAIHVPTGQHVSRASAMCLNNEENWGLRPRYEKVEGKRVQKGFEPTPLQQLLSMAQTRAESKCLSNLLKYVAKLAGFAVTPADEMTSGDDGGNGKGGTQRPQEKAAGAGTTNGAPAGNVITEGQRKRLYAISKQQNMPDDVLREVVLGYGFDRSDAITKDKYEAVVSSVENWSAK